MGDQIKILIVDDHEVVREGYGYMLKVFEDIALTASVASLEETIQECESSQPDVVLIDMYLQDLNGLDVIKIIKERYEAIHVIAITSYEKEPTLVQHALEAGAKGFVYKTISIDELASAIRKVAKNEYYLSSDATENFILSRTTPSQALFELTKRESEVLQYLSQGLSNGEIAQNLHLSINTAKFHVRSLIRKFNASSRKDVIRIARQNRLLK